VIETVHLRGLPLRWGYLHEPMVRVLNMAAIWSHRSGLTVQLTSFNDHEHGPRSLHDTNWALDFDVAGNRTADLQRLSSYLRKHLGPEFDVVFEGNHVHVEFDLGKAV
jgi:hypothetical protein